MSKVFRAFFGAMTIAFVLAIAGCNTSQVSSMQVTPATQTLSPGQTVQLTATGTATRPNHPSSVSNETDAVTWTSSTQSVATVSGTGLVTAVGPGTSTITASMNGFGGTLSATCVITVTGTGTGTDPGKPNYDIVSVSIIPGSQTALAYKQTAQFIAIGTTGSGATVNLTNQSTMIGGVAIKPAVWSSSVTSVASIDAASGVATAFSSGTTNITALVTNPDGTVASGSSSLTVNLPGGSSTGEPLVSLSIVPGNETLTTANQSANFVVVGTTSSETTVNLTNVPASIGGTTVKAATWASSVPSAASIDSKTGVVTALANGSTAITAMASNPDGTVVTATAAVTVNISATPEPIVSMSIIPNSQSAFAINQKVQFIAIGTTGDGKTKDLTGQANWSVSNSGVATMNPTTGVATAVSAGSTAVAALVSNPDGSVVTGAAVLTVSAPPTPEPLVSISIVPGSQVAYALKQTAQFIAIGTTGQGTTVDLTGQAVWSSSNTFVGSIDSKTGLATAVTAGTTAITAVATNPDGTAVTGSGVFTVVPTATPEPIVSMQLIPSPQTVLAAGESAQFYAIGTTGGGTSVDLTNQAKWNATNATVGTVTGGLATGSAPGSTAIVAMVTNPDGTVVTGTGSFTVMNDSWTSLTVLPGSVSATGAGEVANYIAIGTKVDGSSVDLTSLAQWQSSDTSIATVDSAGRATATGNGIATITAIYKNPDNTVVQGSATYDVSITAAREPLLSIAILPSTFSVVTGYETNQFLAIGTFSSPAAPNPSGLNCAPSTGITRDCTTAVTWSSSDVKVATINSSGLATALNNGTTAIIAQATNPDGTVVTGSGSFSFGGNTTGTQYATLTITLLGANAANGLVTFNPQTAGSSISCSTTQPQNCVYTVPLNTQLTLTPTVTGKATFSGWSVPCLSAGTSACTLTLTNNQTVAAIFN